MDTERSTGGAGRARGGSGAPGASSTRPQQQGSPETAVPSAGIDQPGAQTMERERSQAYTAGRMPEKPGLIDQAREGALNQLDKQRERAATGLSSMVDALRQSGRQLEGENAPVASYMQTAASQMERFVGGLREKDLRRMMSDLERFARRRPGVFLGSAFVLGLCAARFLKSSGTPDEPWRSSSSGSDEGIGSSRGYTSPATSDIPTGWTESQRTASIPPQPSY